MPRLLLILPSWLGDCVMATPALRLLRARLPGAFVGALLKPGMDELFAGSDFFDEVHIGRAGGVMGHKHDAARVRARRYDTALLFTNSFSTALVARIAGIPRRIGYDRDARGLLLTDRLQAPKRPDGSYAPIPAVNYYLELARCALPLPEGGGRGVGSLAAAPTCDAAPEPSASLPSEVSCTLTTEGRLELSTTPDQERAADSILERAAIPPGAPLAILNPGGNNPAKRWPAERFIAVGAHLARAHGLRILVNGSPAESELAQHIAGACAGASLPSLGITIGALKAIARRARLMVTNDTGPRHIAGAFGVPLVTLFGPTDHRWTTIPTRGPEKILLADPSLPESEIADDHPERCAIEKIDLARVIEACDEVLAPSGTSAPAARPI